MGKAENYVESYLKKQSEKAGYLCLKFTSPSYSGVPDRVLIGHGKTIFVETKSDVGKLRRLQEEVIKKMRKHGAIVFIANSRELVDKLLNDLKEM